MDWTEALDLIGPHAWRWRELCEEGSGQHVEARLTVVRLAGGEPVKPDTEADRQLRAYVATHGCGGCGH